MGIFFSKKKPSSSRITEQDKAILVNDNKYLIKGYKIMINLITIFLQQLKQTRDKLKQYQKRIELNIEKDRELAKKLIKNDRKE